MTELAMTIALPLPATSCLLRVLRLSVHPRNRPVGLVMDPSRADG
jgi:hypothetical protein